MRSRSAMQSQVQVDTTGRLDSNPPGGSDCGHGVVESGTTGGSGSQPLLKKIIEKGIRKRGVEKRKRGETERREEILILNVEGGCEIHNTDRSKFNKSLKDLDAFHVSNRKIAVGSECDPPTYPPVLFATDLIGYFQATLVKPRNPLLKADLPNLMEAGLMNWQRRDDRVRKGSSLDDPKKVRKSSLDTPPSHALQDDVEVPDSPKDASDRKAVCKGLMETKETSKVKPAPRTTRPSFPKKTYPAQPKSEFMVKVDEVKTDPAVIRFVAAWCTKYAETFPTLMAPKLEDIQPIDWLHSRTIVNRVGTEDKITNFLDFLFFYWPRYQEHFAKKVPPVPTITHTSYNLEDLVGRFGMVGTLLATVDRIEAMRARGDSMSFDTEEQYRKALAALKTFRYLE